MIILEVTQTKCQKYILMLMLHTLKMSLQQMFIIFSTHLLECLALNIQLIKVKMTYVKDIAS